MNLLDSAQVSSFLHGTVLSSLHATDKVNQVGILRKVIIVKSNSKTYNQGACTMIIDTALAQIFIHHSPSYDLRRRTGFNWCSELTLSTEAKEFGAIKSMNNVLVNVGDYVVFIGDSEVRIIKLK